MTRPNDTDRDVADHAEALLQDLLTRYLILNLADAADGDPAVGWQREVAFQAARSRVHALVAAGLAATRDDSATR